MIENPIHKVLSVFRTFDVRCLLMGGQACVFYGGAEFSRDTDVALLAERDNLERLRRALSELRAETIAVPPLEIGYLLRGHAVHFRCAHPEAQGLRIDAMSVLRGLPAFPVLWERRSTVRISEDMAFDLMSLPDLVQAKKTQRDKDWPMIRRLVEADYVSAEEPPSLERVRFWFRESRTPSMLIELAGRYPDIVRTLREERSALAGLPNVAEPEVTTRLRKEEDEIRALDRAYWLPLRKELEALRRTARSAKAEPGAGP